MEAIKLQTHTHTYTSLLSVEKFLSKNQVVADLSHLAFVNYHKCQNRQKTTDDLAHVDVSAFSSLFCRSSCSPLFITRSSTPASGNYSLPLLPHP